MFLKEVSSAQQSHIYLNSKNTVKQSCVCVCVCVCVCIYIYISGGPLSAHH